MTQIILKSEIGVEVIQQVGNDETLAHAAWVSTKGIIDDLTKPADPVKVRSVLKFLMEKRHGTPFEQGFLTIRVHAPIKVWREWHRHRVGFCLAGDTLIRCGSWYGRKSISEVYQNWHHGVVDSTPMRLPIPDSRFIQSKRTGKWRANGYIRDEEGNRKWIHLGYYETRKQAEQAYEEWWENNKTPTRVRLLPACKNLQTRVLNEETQFFEQGRMKDVYESGIKELLLVETEKHNLKCSKDHRIYTDHGWVTAGELRKGDRIAVLGKRSMFAEKRIPPSLRRGIGVWTSAQRNRMIKETDRCYVCNKLHPREVLILDHVIPVVSDLLRALDITNLKPICPTCHRIKTNGEQNLARRGCTAGSRFVPITRTPKPCSEEMTYDIEIEGPWHNFLANNIVVHNSYAEESGRYKQLEPVFYIPPCDRLMIRPEGFKSSRPEFDQATDEEYDAVCKELKIGYALTYEIYERLLGLQVDRGLARDVLGVGIYSACWVSCNPRSIMHFLELRTDHPEAKRPSKPLHEIRVAADKLEAIFARYWPMTHELWVAHGRQCP